MRPHTVAYIAVLLYFLVHPDAATEEFYIEVEIKGATKDPLRQYDLEVISRTPDSLKIKVGRMWRCIAEIEPRYPNSTSKFFITHDHNTKVKEEINVYTSRVEGRYVRHRSYTTFSSPSNKPETLAFSVGISPLIYEVETFRVK